MIEFHYETDFRISGEKYFADWISRVMKSEGSMAIQLDYIFCNDDFLLDINTKYLGHDTYTDIISFDYSEGKQLAGDIFISVDRVEDNAKRFATGFDQELLRVMAHGILHLMGYNDKTLEEVILMRSKEEEKIKMFHVEQ